MQTQAPNTIARTQTAQEEIEAPLAKLSRFKRHLVKRHLA
jgi:hypothetical protein